jgi:hypothetical protein
MVELSQAAYYVVTDQCPVLLVNTISEPLLELMQQIPPQSVAAQTDLPD